MGIIDKIGNVAGGGNLSSIGMIMSLINQFGGISGLLQKFQQNGLGHIVQSWTGDGQKLPINPEQLKSALGSEPFENVSQKSGLPPNQLIQQVSQLLPGIVSKLTSGGNIPSGNLTEDQVEQSGIGDILSGLLNRKTG